MVEEVHVTIFPLPTKRPFMHDHSAYVPMCCGVTKTAVGFQNDFMICYKTSMEIVCVCFGILTKLAFTT